ncbi:hypothetical protein OVA24_13085 [Luteolibacter sp. SL250]|uniref:hypothetical protein n=1 Tax=Luteolibacter sp. SL250 TaxID=2995170 RepID=UPI00226F4C63|nr:hypothetical protein [Luteolibacter sp. SL250]WAC18171.1 hypothetical protein OVA24_13085 [Luteolibacter sp. SL250]
MNILTLASGIVFSSCAFADMTVVFPDNRKFAESDGSDFLVASTIPGDFKTPEGVVAATLFLGNQVRDKRLSAPFFPDTLSGSSHFEGAQPLGSYFRGARIEGKTFVISFTGESMRYLNNTAGIQQSVKGALEATIMKNFPGIQAVSYEIDGKIVSDWDA